MNCINCYFNEWSIDIDMHTVCHTNKPQEGKSGRRRTREKDGFMALKGAFASPRKHRWSPQGGAGVTRLPNTKPGASLVRLRYWSFRSTIFNTEHIQLKKKRINLDCKPLKNLHDHLYIYSCHSIVLYWILSFERIVAAPKHINVF